jgi:hypothetical protein
VFNWEQSEMITLVSGDKLNINGAIKVNGAPMDLTGLTVEWIFKKTAKDKDIDAIAEGSLSGASDGKFSIPLRKLTTKQEEGIYYLGVRVKDSEGETLTFKQTSLTILPSYWE